MISITGKPATLRRKCYEGTRPSLGFTARFYTTENSITFKKHILVF
jgi:hypothetical protein